MNQVTLDALVTKKQPRVVGKWSYLVLAGTKQFSAVLFRGRHAI